MGPYPQRRFRSVTAYTAEERAERVSPLRVEATSGCGLKDVAYPGRARPVRNDNLAPATSCPSAFG